MGPTVGQAAKRVRSNTQPHSALLKEDKAKKIIKLPPGAVARMKRTNVHGALERCLNHVPRVGASATLTVSARTVMARCSARVTQ